MSHLLWSSGKRATILELQGERVVLRSESPFAPGTPLSGQIEAHPGRALRLKVNSCKKSDDAFVIEGRAVDLTRDLRALVEEILRAPAPG